MPKCAVPQCHEIATKTVKSLENPRETVQVCRKCGLRYFKPSWYSALLPPSYYIKNRGQK